jgi:hypothetical protein
MTSVFNQPFFEVGVDSLQPFSASLALSLAASDATDGGRLHAEARRSMRCGCTPFTALLRMERRIHPLDGRK